MKKLLIGTLIFSTMSSFASETQSPEEKIEELTQQNKELKVVIPNTTEDSIKQYVRFTGKNGSFDYVMKFKENNCEVIFPGLVEYDATVYNHQVLTLAYKFSITAASKSSNCSQRFVDMLERDAANGGLRYISRSSSLDRIISGNTFRIVNPLH